MKHLVLLVAVAVLCTFSSNACAAEKGKCVVDMSKATAKDMQKLTGVGPKIAKKIMDYRKVNRAKATKAGKKVWNFNTWAELLKVEGVGDKICKDNIGKVCFSGKLQKACPKPAARKKAPVKK